MSQITPLLNSSLTFKPYCFQTDRSAWLSNSMKGTTDDKGKLYRGTDHDCFGEKELAELGTHPNMLAETGSTMNRGSYSKMQT